MNMLKFVVKTWEKMKKFKGYEYFIFFFLLLQGTVPQAFSFLKYISLSSISGKLNM